MSPLLKSFSENIMHTIAYICVVVSSIESVVVVFVVGREGEQLCERRHVTGSVVVSWLPTHPLPTPGAGGR